MRGAMPAPMSLQRLPLRTPSYAPAHAATFSPGAVTSGAARQGKVRDALLAAARTVRAKSDGSFLNHSRNNSVTLANGSGRRRPRGAFAFGLLVEPTSPSLPYGAQPPTGIARLWARTEQVVSAAAGRSAICDEVFLSRHGFQQQNRVQVRVESC